MNRIRDRYFRNPDDSKTFVPTSDYSRLDVNKRQAVFRCREECRTRTQPTRGMSELAVPPPPPPPRGPQVVHVDPVAYTAMVAELNAAREEKRLRTEAQAPLTHAPLPSGNVRPERLSDLASGSMFSERARP